MISKIKEINIIKLIIVIIGFSHIALFSSLAYSQSPVTLSVGCGTGNPLSTGSVQISLENTDDVTAVQMDLCDVGNLLVPIADDPQNNIYACEPTNRASNFWCLVNELSNGCLAIVFFALGETVSPGTGSIFTINYNVGGIPGECRDLNIDQDPATLKVGELINDVNVDVPFIDILTNDGNFCFNNPPSCTSVLPETGNQAQPLDLTITGEFTHFDDGVTTVSFSNPGITVNSTTVNSPTEVTVNITIAEDASTGAGDVMVETARASIQCTEGIVCAGGFTVLAAVETCLGVSPGTGMQSEQKQVVITGDLTNFDQTYTTVSFENSGITVINTNVDSPNQVTVTINVAYNAPPGIGDVTVTTGTEGIVCYNAFEVLERMFEVTEIRESNPTSASFTISWITDADSDGEVHYSTDPTFSSHDTAYDDRGFLYLDNTHHVTIDNLDPETIYYYEVVSGGTIDNNGGLYYSFKTMKIPIDPPPNCIVYGWVYQEDGNTPAEGTMVYLQVTQAPPGSELSYFISTLVDSNGTWVLNLGNLYSTLTDDVLPYSEGDPLSLEFQGASGRVYSAQYTVPASCPLNTGSIILDHFLSIEMDLDTGFTLIALPFDPITDENFNEITTYTAYSMIADVPCSQAFSWDTNAQSWLSALEVGGVFYGDDFPIEAGKGYFVKCNSDTITTFYGKEIASLIPLTFEPGFNLISIPYPPDYYTACSLINDIPGASKSFSWHSNFQKWLSALIDGTDCIKDDDFPVDLDKGYFTYNTTLLVGWLPSVGASCLADENCDDNNVCTDDACVFDVCQYTNNTVACDDGLFCTENDVCSGGVCGGTVRDCSASGDECNDGVCDDNLDQCVTQPKADGTTCDDGLYCTVSDQCTGGVCSTGIPLDCTDGNVCTQDNCDPVAGCQNPPEADGTACDDATVCNGQETCQAGTCTAGTPPLDCTDGNVCTQDNCDPVAGCQNPPEADGTACDDATFCNGTDTCSGGSCSVHVGDPCAGGAECNSTCQEATSSCFDLPGTACTDDGNVCTDDTCDGSGICAHPDNTDPCDDGLFCNQTDECQGGLCIGSDDPCVDNNTYCDGVEYCEEDIGSYLCSSTGDPCDLLTCDEVSDLCVGSEVSLIISDSSGTPGTIDIGLGNENNQVSGVVFNLCDEDQSPWLTIDTTTCTLMGRTSGALCTLTDVGSSCVEISITPLGVISMGTGTIAQLSYTLDATAPPGEYADLNPENVDIRDDSDNPLTVTPVPGSILVPVPSHFTPIATTATWMRLWGTFMISDIDAEVGDEVGVFVDNDCFGAYRVDTPGFYGYLYVYGDDPVTPAKDGADPGDLLTIKIWDMNEEGEHVLSTNEYTVPDPLTWTNGVTEQVDINAEDHFTPVAQTTTWMDLWGTFTIDGFDAKVGDEVGVFVGNDCFGAYKVGTPGWYGFLPVYGNDPVTPAKDGADPGDLLTIKIWDSNEGVEYTLTTADYTVPDPLTWTDGSVVQADIHATDILASWYNNLYPVNEYICRVEPPDNSNGRNATGLSDSPLANIEHMPQVLVLFEGGFEGSPWDVN